MVDLGVALPDGHTLVSYAERPDLIDRADHFNGSVWPEFMLQDSEADKYWHLLDTVFLDYQLVLLDPDGQIAATNTEAHGFRSVIACVRPTDKHRYPLIPIDQYAFWTRPDGEPFDPWIRLHARLGGRIVRGSPNAMTIRGTIADWRRWTGEAFPSSGQYLLPVAAAPITIDLERDEGVYFDPNVWMVHAVDPA